MHCVAVHGALQCLALFADELTDEQVAQVMVVTPCAKGSTYLNAHTHCAAQQVKCGSMRCALRWHHSAAACAQGAPFLLAQLLHIVQAADVSAPEVPRHALSILSSLLATLFSITEGMRTPDGTLSSQTQLFTPSLRTGMSALCYTAVAPISIAVPHSMSTHCPQGTVRMSGTCCGQRWVAGARRCLQP